MKTHKTFKIMLMALILFTASLSITSVDAEAKAYKAKTITVTEGKHKTIITKKKIKKIVVTKGKNCFGVGLVHKDGSVWDNPKAAKGKKKFAVWGTGYGRKYEVKVTYKNKYTQKFKIKTVLPSYAQKIVNELKPLLANPDKGLETILDEREKTLDKHHEVILKNMTVNGDVINRLTRDEITKNYTNSQKKAIILTAYFRWHMQYSMAYAHQFSSREDNTNNNAWFKKVYNGTFKGVCADGAEMGKIICRYLGIKAQTFSSSQLDHEWLCVWTTNKSGVSYWHGVGATAFAISLKKSATRLYENITKKKIKKHGYNPGRTEIGTQPKRYKPSVKPPTPKPATTATPAPVQIPSSQVPDVTPAPTQTTTTVVFSTPEPSKTETPAVQCIVIPHDEHGYTCPGCKAPNRHTSKTNPYITNGTAKDGDLIVYKHTTSEGVRWFDADGNEYIDVNNNGFITDELDKLQK